jgi:hypothetical protein
MVSLVVFLHLHLSKDSQSTSIQFIAINKSLIGKIPFKYYSLIINNRVFTHSSFNYSIFNPRF